MFLQKEEMELRAAMRSRASVRPKRRGGGGRGGAARDDSDDEGGVSLAAIKNKYKQGQKGKRPTEVYALRIASARFLWQTRVFFFGYRENHRITPAARRERQAVSDSYRLKTLYAPSIAVSHLNGSRDRGRV